MHTAILIGFNDLYSPIGDEPTPWCQLAATDAIAAFHQVDGNLHTIFSRLHGALGCMGRIIVLNYYDAYQNVCAHAPTTEVSSSVTLNTHSARAAAAFRIPVADVYAALHGKKTPNPRLCVLTYMCSDGDIHPTPAGHALIAKVLKKTAGYQ